MPQHGRCHDGRHERDQDHDRVRRGVEYAKAQPGEGDDHLDDAAGVHAGARAMPSRLLSRGRRVSACELAEDRDKHDDQGRQGDRGPGKHREVNAQSGGRQEERGEDGQHQRASAASCRWAIRDAEITVPAMNAPKIGC